MFRFVDRVGLKHVVAVEREGVANQRPANCAKRQAFDVLILREILTDAVRVAAGGDVQVAHGQRAMRTAADR